MTKNTYAATYLETGAVENLPDGHFINGNRVDEDSGQKMQSFDPALAEPFGELALGNAVDMDKAITAAEKGACCAERDSADAVTWWKIPSGCL